MQALSPKHLTISHHSRFLIPSLSSHGCTAYILTITSSTTSLILTDPHHNEYRNVFVVSQLSRLAVILQNQSSKEQYHQRSCFIQDQAVKRKLIPSTAKEVLASSISTQRLALVFEIFKSKLARWLLCLILSSTAMTRRHRAK